LQRPHHHACLTTFVNKKPGLLTFAANASTPDFYEN
jgi:hypothetical protein